MSTAVIVAVPRAVVRAVREVGVTPDGVHTEE